MTIRFLRRPDVCQRFGMGRSTLYDWIEKVIFPAPTKLGPRMVAWSIEALDAWESDRAKAGAPGRERAG